MSLLAEDLEQRLIAARRALLRRPLLGAEHEGFGTVRLHQERLRKEFRDEFGYELVVRSDHARLRKRAQRARSDRPARVPRSGLHPDNWPAFTRSHYICFALALAAAERSSAQVTIGMLAEEIRSIAREEGIELDFDRSEMRRCLADALAFLDDLGVIVMVAGTAERWVRSQEDEALYDLDHARLDDLLVSARVIGAEEADDLLEPGPYPSTEYGTNLRRKHYISRHLAEDPVLYLADLDEEHRDYYTNPAVRGPRDRQLAELFGLHAERRREGTALVDGDARDPLTDLRFPIHQPWQRQAALLLGESIAARVNEGQGQILESELAEDCEQLLVAYGEALSSEPLEVVLEQALQVLERMLLVERGSAGIVKPLPALARFSSVDMEDAQRRLQLGEEEDEA